jgi:hypothetical protein
MGKTQADFHSMVADAIPTIKADITDCIRAVFIDSIRNVLKTVIYLVIVNCIINNFLT